MSIEHASGAEQPSAQVSKVLDEAVVWQWEHRLGWRNYDPRATKRIEESYQCGDSKVRLKTGKVGTTPMEIFFVDMLQYDPITRNTRRVQRLGPENFWIRSLRTVRSFFRSIETGRPRHENCKQYQTRREALHREDPLAEYDVSMYYLEEGASWVFCLFACVWFF